MGKLYDYCKEIERHIERNNLDVFKTRGELALRVGFLISLVDPSDPDDAAKLEALRVAAREALGLHLD